MNTKYHLILIKNNKIKRVFLNYIQIPDYLFRTSKIIVHAAIVTYADIQINGFTS